MEFTYKAGRIGRAIWRGPFYIGKLSQPVSVGDVLLKFLETAWRCIIALLSTAIIIAAAVGAWIQIISPILFPPLKNQIDATISYDVEGVSPPTVMLPPPVGEAKAERKTFRCNAEYPLKVKLTNRSNKTIREIGFDIEARKPGYSKNLNSASYARTTDAILQPGYTLRQCWAIPFDEDGVEVANLNYTIVMRWAYSENE